MEVAPISSSGAIPTPPPRENPTGGNGFREVLDTATAKGGPYVVKRGDTLSRVVLDRMKALGLRPAIATLYERVGEVARRVVGRKNGHSGDRIHH